MTHVDYEKPRLEKIESINGAGFCHGYKFVYTENEGYFPDNN